METAMTYALEPELDVHDFLKLMASSRLGERRPMDDVPRMNQMLRGADLILTARCGKSGAPSPSWTGQVISSPNWSKVSNASTP